MHSTSLGSHSVPGRAGTAANAPRRERFELLQAIYDGKRLASFRRLLGALLIITGAPVIGLGHTTDPAIRRVLTVLTFVWLGLALPMVRLLCSEWYNRRLIERLQAAVDDDVARR